MNSIDTLRPPFNSWTALRSSAAFTLTGFLTGIALLVGTLAPVPAQTTFTKITAGNPVTDGGISWAAGWGDYDNDGWLDLFITNGDFNGNGRNFFYRNNRDGSFTRMSASAVERDSGNFRGCAWIDWNNDGHPDLSVVTHGSRNFLYQNNGDGSFTKLTTNAVVLDIVRNSITGSWADYDRDGNLDYFVANANNVKNFLYRGNNDGTFTKITAGAIANDIADAEAAAWADYDNDGWPDLFVANWRGTKNFLYRNNRDGTFSRQTSSSAGSIAADSIDAAGCAWADYDNDGFPDLFVQSAFGQPGLLYHNNGNGTFTRVTDSAVGSLITEPTFGPGCAWADYDNDGFLDLFIARVGAKALLYRNNGNGTFSRIESGSLVNDGAAPTQSFSAVWGDYNNDGFLDLVVANGGPTLSQNNFLYLNDGNSNSWIKVRCIGTVSNRSAIGAKVRVKATIGGSSIWQMREISHGSGWSSSPLEAHFGLGDATNVETIRIEWPSGTTQEFQNVAARRYLTVTEPARLLATALNGTPQFTLQGGRNLQYDIQVSTDLKNWSPLSTLTITNLDGTALITDTNALESVGRFCRAVLH